MPRIAGVDIPVNKQVWVSLTYIFGIGRTRSYKILEDLAIDATIRVSDMADEDVNRIREVVDKEYIVEGDLRKERDLNIKRLIEIGSYRGVRHRRNLPVRGQRTRTNARSRRGTRRTVAGRGQRRGATKK
jgi:small subunit ribosomal protein S13